MYTHTHFKIIHGLILIFLRSRFKWHHVENNFSIIKMFINPVILRQKKKKIIVLEFKNIDSASSSPVFKS